MWFEVIGPYGMTDAYRLTAHCGQQAWDMIRLHPMPGDTGFLSAAIVNDHNKHAWRVVYLTTGRAYLPLRDALKDRGGDLAGNLMYLHALCNKLNERLCDTESQTE